MEKSNIQMKKVFPTLKDILVRNMLYLLLRRWSIIFELFSRKFLINGKHPCSFSAAPTPKSVSCPGQSRRAPNDIRDLPGFRLLFRSTVQISNSSFQSIFLTSFLSFSKIPRARGHRRKFALAALSVL